MDTYEVIGSFITNVLFVFLFKIAFSSIISSEKLDNPLNKLSFPVIRAYNESYGEY